MNFGRFFLLTLCFSALIAGLPQTSLSRENKKTKTVKELKSKKEIKKKKNKIEKKSKTSKKIENSKKTTQESKIIKNSKKVETAKQSLKQDPPPTAFISPKGKQKIKNLIVTETKVEIQGIGEDSSRFEPYIIFKGKCETRFCRGIATPMANDF